MFTGPNIVTEGLVLALDAGNKKSYPGSGTTWIDLSGQGNNGVLEGGSSFNSNNNGIISFDGTNDYISVDNLGLSDHTIEGWIYSNNGSQGGNSASTIISVIGNYTATSGTAGKYTYIGFLGNNTLTFRMDDGNTSHRIVADVTYTVNKWYYVTLTYNSNGTIIAFLNSQLIQSRSYTSGVVFDSIPFNIAKTDYPAYFNGSISMVKAYNRALTLQEIQQNYNATKSRFGLT